MASASASSTSLSKQSGQRRKSCDTVCSSNSSCLLHRRKATHPLACSLRPYVSKSSTNVVQQRVSSARLLKLRSVQNQLNDANYHLAELQQENRVLRSLQSRQDKALSKYEGTNADLPRLLKSHEEDIRVLIAKNKVLRKSLKDASEQLKLKEDELAAARDQLKNLVALSKNRNLGERHVLADQVDDLKEQLKRSEEEISVLNRKLILETKNYKYKLNSEISKNKQAQKELSFALAEIDKLSALAEARGKPIINGRKRFASITRQSLSLVSLTGEKLTRKQSEKFVGQNELQSLSSIDIHEANLENQSEGPDQKLDLVSEASSMDETLASPKENAIPTTTTDDIQQIDDNLEALSLSEDYHKVTFVINTPTKKSKLKSGSGSSKKLEELFPKTEDLLSQKPTFTKQSRDIEKRLNNLSNDVISAVKQCNVVVEKHTENFDSVQTETAKLLESLRETDVLNSKLRYNDFLNADSIAIPEKDAHIADEIWKEEFDFRKKSGKSSIDMTMDQQALFKLDRNGNTVRKRSEVEFKEKSKLLATLRAIDNGDEIEELEYKMNKNKNSNLVEELFNVDK